MELQEGQIYKGGISLMGDEGPYRSWLVVAPFGNLHIHSIDDPLDLHCWPAIAAEKGLANNRLKLVGAQPDHPVISLQRLKERHDIRDIDLGLSNENLDKMLRLLEQLLDDSSALAAYAAGEVMAMLRRSAFSVEHIASVEQQITSRLGRIDLSSSI